MAYTFRSTIRFADVDHAKILYFPRFLHYFHCAFEEFFEHSCNFPYHRVLNEHRIGFPSVRVEVDFEQPLRFGDHIGITIEVLKIGSKSVTWRYTVLREETNQRCARGMVVTACMSMDTYRAIEIPPQYRSWFETHLVQEIDSANP